MLKSRRSLRTRIFYAFIFALLPVLLLLALAVELFLVPYIEHQAVNELTNSTRVLANAIDAGANVAIKNHLRAIAERNLDIAQHFFKLVDQGVLSRKQAVEMLRGIFLSQKVGDSGYVYCLDSNSNVVVHPSEALEGESVAGFGFVKEQVRLKNGYLEYEWKNPGEKQERPKALYMVYFEPLDWIISVSSYRSEFKQLLNPDDFRQTVLSVKFGKSGYACVLDDSGQLLIHPKYENFNVLETDELPNDFVKAMIKDKSGYTEYEWKNPGQERFYKKMAVYQTLPEFGWIVVSSAYVYEVMRPVFIARVIAYAALSMMMLAAMGVAYFLSGKLIRPIVGMIEKLDYNSRHGLHELLPVQGSVEVARLAVDFNNFMQAIEERNADLYRERARYRSLFESSPDAVLLLRNIVVIDCSPATLSIFDCRREDIIGKALKDLSPQLQPCGLSSVDMGESIIGKLQPGKMDTFEWQHQTFKGRAFDAEVRLSLFGELDGDKLFVSYIRDITERKRADAAIRRERDFNKALLDASPAYIMSFDREGVIQMVNPALCATLGYPENDLLGLDAFDFIPGVLDNNRMHVLLKELLSESEETPGCFKSGACGIATRSGEERLVQWSGTVVQPSASDPGSVLVVGVDISEERSLQEQLHHAQKLEALGRLAGGVAHDFNNMLGGIIGAAELIEQKISSDDPIRKYVELISDTVDKAAKLSRRLLAFSRKGKKVSTPVDLHQILDDALSIFRSGLDQKIESVVELVAVSHKSVGDPSQLQNVLLNMFINARDAMPDGGVLKVSTSNVTLGFDECAASSFDLDPGSYIEINISDTGTGIAPEIVTKIFEPFFTTKKEGRGTGLGLASVYGAVRDHRGEILVSSEQGKGTVFTLRLPCVDVEVSSEGPKANVVKGKGGILLVDDDEMLRTTGVLLLEELGYNVFSACDGVEALEVYKEHAAEINLTILDMVMPQMNGHDTFYAIRKVNPDAHIIIASGFSDRQSVVELEKDGLLGFVHKPYRLAELSTVIAHSIG